jgi:ribonuclease VapC
MVLSSKLKRDSRSLLAEVLRKMNADIVDFSEIHYDAAAVAFMRFGKGRHPAALNFGDFMSYALSKISGLPLLYSGTDFSRTDIQTV